MKECIWLGRKNAIERHDQPKRFYDIIAEIGENATELNAEKEKCVVLFSRDLPDLVSMSCITRNLFAQIFCSNLEVRPEGLRGLPQRAA